jgi:signal transduction histidine kinase
MREADTAMQHANAGWRDAIRRRHAGARRRRHAAHEQALQ